MWAQSPMFAMLCYLAFEETLRVMSIIICSAFSVFCAKSL